MSVRNAECRGTTRVDQDLQCQGPQFPGALLPDLSQTGYRIDIYTFQDGLNSPSQRSRGVVASMKE
ncbi:hypothetical protein GCM10023220_42650 [Streptomyces ziwulingensis]|uniref:Uncharacterized protein n=1 Tax=Streptomyces ziwulingensis TaxID=1045501 RepID=A0ABP9CBB7_9ACTN